MGDVRSLEVRIDELAIEIFSPVQRNTLLPRLVNIVATFNILLPMLRESFLRNAVCVCYAKVICVHVFVMHGFVKKRLMYC